MGEEEAENCQVVHYGIAATVNEAAQTKAGTAPHRPMSLAAATLRGAPISELAKVAADAGFDHIGVRLSSWDPTARVGLPADLRQTAALISSLGLSVLDVEQVRLRPDSEAREFEYLFEGASVLGARYVLIFADDPDLSRLAGTVHALERIGATYGVRPVLEFMPFTTVRTLDEALAVLEAADLAAPALLIDTLHLARSRADPAQLDRLSHELLPFVHLADAPASPPDTLEGLRREATFDRLLPGQGDLPLRDYLRRLPSIPVALEVPGGAAQEWRERAFAAAASSRALLDTVDASAGR